MTTHQHDLFFTGLIHPQAGYWHLDRPVTMNAGERLVEVFFANSAFNVRVRFSDHHQLGQSGEADSAWLNPIWYEVEAVVQAVLDSLGFVLAAPLDLEMTTGRADADAIVGGLTSFPAFARVEGNRVDAAVLKKYLDVVNENANVRHALADMRMALRLTIDTAFYCYRAIECLRQEFVQAEDGTRTAPSWARMHDALGTSKADMEPLTQLATARRHGESQPLSHEERLKWLRWTRDVVGRYIEEHFPDRIAGESHQPTGDNRDHGAVTAS
ncbi:hypothetical protein [Nocardia carnea]|uniref:hypothetical protein n=1 Tax=Nocardia carnea TaxID=37328 RepID=UPI0024572F7A|nr:hypothetical protein [Nocardia carnea]